MSSVSSRNPYRWQQIQEVFHEASQRDAQDRASFLEETCGSDVELRREVESLLESLGESDRFLQSAVSDAAHAYLQKQTATAGELWCSGHYRIIRLLGAGGMGEVYLAEDTRLKRKVALKTLAGPVTRNPASLRRFEGEAQTVSVLNHANLLTVFDFCHHEGQYVLVTEFVEGETLRQILNRGALPQEEALAIATQIAAALSAAHASGVIHRDIKPENIIVRPDGCVKILDFGIAKLSESPETANARHGMPSLLTTTVSGTVLGTPRYMSPEQARGLEVDARTDIFSLGAVLYEMLTGQTAFQGQTQSDLIADILRSDPPPINRSLPGLPKALQVVVSCALAKDREKRYGKAEDLLHDLQHFRRREELASRSRTGSLLWWAIFALALGVAYFGFWAVRERIQPDTTTAPRSLAILPFHNLKPSADTDFLGFSLADEVITRLGYVKALTVRPSSAVNRYRDGAGDLRKAAADLKAEMLLTGTYLKDGDDLKITARLIGVRSMTVLWQKTLTVKYGKLLTVQDSVAQMIIQGLQLQLGADEQARLKHEDTVNNLAYEYFLRGVDLYAISKFSAAITMLEKSRDIDPGYAPMWAYLGRAYTTNASLQFGGREDYRRAEAAYDQAIALDPALPEPRVYMANLLTDTGRVELSVPLLRVALRSSPNHAEAHWELGYAYRFGGMLKESVAESELARRLNPEVKITSATLNTYLYLGEYDQFLNSLPVNDTPLLVFYHGLASYYKNNFTEARNDFDRAYELAPNLLQAQVGKSLSEGISHHAEQGITRLRETERRVTAQGVADPEAMYKIAQAYAVLGDNGSALQMLQRSTTGGFFPYSYIAHDPLLDTLHGSPEFLQILEQAHRRQEQFQRRFAS